MAEGWARHLRSDQIEAYSAGVAPCDVDPRAIRAMAEAGVDISAHRPKHVAKLAGLEPDCVVTVCDYAREHCGVFPRSTRVVHVAFDDPPSLAWEAATEAEAMAHYRRVRDEIRAFVEGLPAALTPPDASEKNGK